MDDALGTEFDGGAAVAKILVDTARAKPDKAAALGQAFVHAGVQVAVDQVGEAETATWLRHLASLLEQVAARNAFGNRIN